MQPISRSAVPFSSGESCGFLSYEKVINGTDGRKPYLIPPNKKYSNNADMKVEEQNKAECLMVFGKGKGVLPY